MTGPSASANSKSKVTIWFDTFQCRASLPQRLPQSLQRVSSYEDESGTSSAQMKAVAPCLLVAVHVNQSVLAASGGGDDQQTSCGRAGDRA